jgi:hypothetical protein
MHGGGVHRPFGEEDAMARKPIGWIILAGCGIVVAAAVLSEQSTIPQIAQAATPSAQSHVVPAETTQACQAVLSQIVSIQQILIDEKRSGTIKPLAAFDELVAQEYRIDTSKCPPDFRMAVLHFVTAEDSACTHTHMDKTGRDREFLGALAGVFVTRGVSTGKSLQSLNDYNEKIADEQKQDLANIQSAMLNLVQVSMNYGVK